jgi:hypothetical protein
MEQSQPHHHQTPTARTWHDQPRAVATAGGRRGAAKHQQQQQQHMHPEDDDYSETPRKIYYSNKK